MKDIFIAIITSWPLAILLVGWFSREQLSSFLANRNITIGSKGVELVIAELKENTSLSSFQRKELNNLTAHEIWALDSFTKMTVTTEKANVAQKVAAVSLRDIGLVEIKENNIIVTELGSKLLKIANEML